MTKTNSETRKHKHRWIVMGIMLSGFHRGMMHRACVRGCETHTYKPATRRESLRHDPDNEGKSRKEIKVPIMKVTAKDFMDGKTTRTQAREIAQTVNDIDKALLAMSPKDRADVLDIINPPG